MAFLIILQMPWPRTPTEKMLVDMFEGGSAQFLAILESLSDSNRRILLSSPPTQDNEPEILDVFVELFIAAQEILAGLYLLYSWPLLNCHALFKTILLFHLNLIKSPFFSAVHMTKKTLKILLG